MILKSIYDEFGNKFDLYDEVLEHIKKYHPEIKNIEMIKDILKDADVIVRSHWDENSHLYYKKYGHLYRVVVVQTKEKRIKTTLTTDKIKKGVILWEKQ